MGRFDLIAGLAIAGFAYMAWVFFRESFDLTAGVAAILDLAFTIRILRRVRRIEEGFTRQARLPDYQKTLWSSIKSLKKHREAKDGPRVRSVLTACRTTLEDMAVHLREEERRLQQVLHLSSSISEVLQSHAENTLWNHCSIVIDGLEAVHQTLGNFMKDMQWRGRDA